MIVTVGRFRSGKTSIGNCDASLAPVVDGENGFYRLQGAGGAHALFPLVAVVAITYMGGFQPGPVVGPAVVVPGDVAPFEAVPAKRDAAYLQAFQSLWFKAFANYELGAAAAYINYQS